MAADPPATVDLDDALAPSPTRGTTPTDFTS